jgi:ketosteroid isomerase-like protein
MKKLAIITSAIVFLFGIFSACGPKNAGQQNTTDSTATNGVSAEAGIRAANDSLYSGLNAMFAGDLQTLENLWSHTETITYTGPFGGRITGWEEVYKDFKKTTDMKLGGKIVCSDLHVYAGTDMGYTVCVEVGENMDPEGKPIRVSHRATNIFHLENGLWKLVHHHTDISTQLEKAFEEDTE